MDVTWDMELDIFMIFFLSLTILLLIFLFYNFYSKLSFNYKFLSFVCFWKKINLDLVVLEIATSIH